MFGNSPCAINLQQQINEIEDQKLQKKLQKSVSRFLQMHYLILKNLESIQDVKSRNYLYSCWKKSVIVKNVQMPDKIFTHSVNLLMGKARENLFNWNPPFLELHL